VKVFITGSESFIGSVLWDRLKSGGYQVSGMDVAANVRTGSVSMDLRDPDLQRIVPENSKIVHLAALSTDAMCAANQQEALGVNIGGTVNLVSAAIRRQCPQFVFASTEWVYGDVENNETQRETDILDLRKIKSYYALTKKIGEEILLSSQLTQATILRFGIVYGLRKANHSAVEKICTMALEGKIEIGSRKTGRRFLHVNDICDGIHAAILANKAGIFNLTGSKVISLGEIGETCSKVLNKPVSITDNPSALPSIRNPDNSKASIELNWTPKYNLESGLKEIINNLNQRG
jgi:nucleoside-diphosphate-sugar epimerase